MQNKELLTHLQKLMSQLQQLQSLQLPLATAPPPPQNSSPEQTAQIADNVESILTAKASATTSASSATATAVSNLPPVTQTDETMPIANQSDTPPAGSPPVSSPPLVNEDTPLLPTLTSTPSPVPSGGDPVEPSDSPIPKITDQSMSLGIDVELLTSQTATNDPFAPQDSEQLSSS